jgi:hypothetical protein
MHRRVRCGRRRRDPKPETAGHPSSSSEIRWYLAEDNGADLYKDEAVRLLGVLASFTAVLGLATPPQANAGPDADFLAALKNAGITYQSGPDAIIIGRRACGLMDQGHSQADVVKAMTDQNPGFTTDGATQFAVIAENTLCPQHIGGAVSPPPPPQPSQPEVPPFFPWPPLPGAM